MNIIDRIPRTAVAVVLGAGMVVTPLVAFAQNDASATVTTSGAVTVPVPAAASQVAINAKGSAEVKNAKVTSVSSSTITATTQWGGNTLTWTVTTDSSTKFLFKGGKTAALSNIAAGDVITFSGALAGNNLTVAANSVRDLSKEKSNILEKHTFEGKLQAAIGTTSLPTSFTLSIGNAIFSVNVPVGTPILSKNWASTNLSTFQSGDTVRVYGSAEASTSNILDAVVVRNATR